MNNELPEVCYEIQIIYYLLFFNALCFLMVIFEMIG